MKCWGLNTNGQLGQGSTTPAGTTGGTMGDYLPSIELGSGRSAYMISVGNYFSCVVLDNGDTKCWGHNNEGQLGQGSTTAIGKTGGTMGDYLDPIDVGSGRNVDIISCGGYHVCSILDDDSMKCWGYNIYGQLGLGSTTSQGTTSFQIGFNDDGLLFCG